MSEDKHKRAQERLLFGPWHTAFRTITRQGECFIEVCPGIDETIELYGPVPDAAAAGHIISDMGQQLMRSGHFGTFSALKVKKISG
jgi:hypothetical protein